MCYFGSCQDKSFFFLTGICKGREGGEWLELKLAFKKSEKKNIQYYFYQKQLQLFIVKVDLLIGKSIVFDERSINSF